MAAVEAPAKRLADLTPGELTRRYNAAVAAHREAHAAVEYWRDERDQRAGYAALGIEPEASVEEAEAELSEAPATLDRADAAMRWLRGLPMVRGTR
jgi:hypothetical protein